MRGLQAAQEIASRAFAERASASTFASFAWAIIAIKVIAFAIAFAVARPNS